MAYKIKSKNKKNNKEVFLAEPFDAGSGRYKSPNVSIIQWDKNHIKGKTIYSKDFYFKKNAENFALKLSKKKKLPLNRGLGFD